MLEKQYLMILNAIQTLLIVLAIFSMSSAVQACLPRVGISSGNPLLWSLFGQRGTNDDEPKPNIKDTESEKRAAWTTKEWIEQHKYVLEGHNVTTEDGYELQLQRLPQLGHQPILLLHGLLTSSLSWVLMGPDKSLAFLLSDKKYDVWLANMRGSLYGRGHTQLNESDAEFWNYSFHEWGFYDLPAILDYIRNETSFHNIVIISHSQGFNAVLVLCSMKPEYNDRILLLQALAPIAELRNYVKFGSQDVRKVMKFIKAKLKSQSYEVFPAGELKQKCLKSNSEEREACKSIREVLAGAGQHSKSLNTLIYESLLRGGSLKEVQHLHQIWMSGDFVAYDYSVEGNRQHYNSVEPYNYRLWQVTLPLVLHFGETDALATPASVHHIYSELLDSVVGVYRVPSEKFNHFDFICADDVRSLVNEKVIDIMEKYLSGKLPKVIE